MIATIALALLMQTVPASVPAQHSPPTVRFSDFGPIFFTEGTTFYPNTLLTLSGLTEEAKRPDVIAVVITGHADTAGTQEYNQALSEARARAVAEHMIAAGVDPALVTTIGMGERALARPTADDTAEFLNRRATVEIRYRSPT